MFRSEKELSKLEKQCAIKQRWNWSNETAKKIVLDLILAERKELVETLRTLAHERKFLLKMKRLYASMSFLEINNNLAMISSIGILLSP